MRAIPVGNLVLWVEVSRDVVVKTLGGPFGVGVGLGVAVGRGVAVGEGCARWKARAVAVTAGSVGVAGCSIAAGTVAVGGGGAAPVTELSSLEPPHIKSPAVKITISRLIKVRN